MRRSHDSELRSTVGGTRPAPPRSDPSDVDTRRDEGEGEGEKVGSAGGDGAVSPSWSHQLGRYLVMGELGRGGMGVVLRAYDPKLQREVALKTLHARELRGSMRARLLREAQAMAQLSHPNVVSVYDVDCEKEQVTIAMELVNGRTLKQWLVQEQRPATEVVERFIRAGRGLAAAHEAGLLHRDFKPSNVLIGTRGSIKVTDFGLARITATVSDSAPGSYGDEPWTRAGAAELTRSDVVMGTPAFMPPEQHHLRELTAAVDQYAFCVSLWWALTGRYPFPDRDHGVTGQADLLALKMKGPPPWPREVPLCSRWVAAIERGMAPVPSDRWPHMRALLDALSIDPRRRRRYQLGAGLVVLGAGGVLGGVLHDRISTHRACAEAGTQIDGVWGEERSAELLAAFAESGVGYAVDTWARASPRIDRWAERWREQRVEACLEHDRARPEATSVAARTRACFEQQLAGLRTLVQRWAAPDESVVRATAGAVWGLASPLECRDVSALAASASPEDEGEDEVEVAALRSKLAESAALRAMGEYEDALVVARRVLEVARVRPYRRLVIESRLATGELLDRLGHYHDATERLEEAFILAERQGDDLRAYDAATALARVAGIHLAVPEDGFRWVRLAEAKRWRLALEPDDPRVATLMFNLAGIHRLQGRYDDAERSYQHAVSIRQRAMGAEHPDVAAGLHGLAGLYAEQARYAEALEVHRRVLEIKRSTLGPEHPSVASTLNGIGVNLRSQEDDEEAERAFTQALALFERSVGPRSLDGAVVLNNLGILFSHAGNFERAVAYHRRALSTRELRLGPDHPDVAVSLSNLSEVLRQQKRFAEATETQLRAISVLEASLGPEHPSLATSLASLGTTYMMAGRHQDSVRPQERALEIRIAALGEGHPAVAGSKNNLATLFRALGRYDEAEVLYREAASSFEAALGPDHRDLGVVWGNLAEVLNAQGRHDEAWDTYERVLAIYRTHDVEQHPNIAMSWAGMSEIEIARGAFDSALARLERALAMFEAFDAVADDFARVRFAMARAHWGKGRRSRARRLVEQAAREVTTPSLRAEIEAWRAEHG